VEATGIRSDSNVSSAGSLTGGASFNLLTLSGELVNGDTLTFSGNAAPDTVLYKSSTVTITLDEQTLLFPPERRAALSVRASPPMRSTFSSTTRSSKARRSPATSPLAKVRPATG
jgi:hypothetical protein